MSEALKLFRRVYPEKEVQILEQETMADDSALFKVSMPDGIFWFFVKPSHGVVSCSYNSYESAKNGLGY